MSEISEEDPIKISEDVPRLSEAVSKVPTRPRMCFAEKASLQSFWLEIRILGEQTWLWFSDCWRSNCTVFKSETESAFQKLNFLFLKVELKLDFQILNCDFQNVKLRCSLNKFHFQKSIYDFQKPKTNSIFLNWKKKLIRNEWMSFWSLRK